jgi:hypothetical protein
VIHRIVDVFSGPTIRHQKTKAKLGKMGGNPRLAHAKDFLKLRYREFLLTQEKEQAEAGIIGKKAE